MFWRKRFQVLGLGLLVLLADQASKLWVLRSLAPHEGFEVVPDWFNIVLVFNRGAVWGFLNRTDITWQRGFFIIASLAATAMILFLAGTYRTGERLARVGLGLVLGGALGNLVDRVRLGHVVDFLDFYHAGWHWPAFNLADSAICVGVGLLLLTTLRPEHKA